MWASAPDAGAEDFGIITSPGFSVQMIAENKIGESGNWGFVLFRLGFWIATTFGRVRTREDFKKG